jgi:hypothetical protein
MENTIFNFSDFPNYQRPVYYADKDAPATTTISSIAAALASASVVFRGDGSNAEAVAHADLLLERAKMLFNFVNTYMVKVAVTVAGERSEGVLKNKYGKLVDSGFAGGRWDDEGKKQRPAATYPAYLAWASLWIHEAELKKNTSYGNAYLNRAVEYTDNSKYAFPPRFEDGSRGTLYDQVSWDWGKPGRFNFFAESMCYILLAKHFGMDTPIHHTLTDGGKDGKTYGNLIEALADGSLTSTVTESGMPDFAYQHLALSGMQSATFCMLVSADKLLKSTHPNYSKYIAFAKQIVDYTLGENNYNRSFLIGFNPPGKIPTYNVLHGPAQGFWDNPILPWTPLYPGSDELGDHSKIRPRHVCYGALVGPAYDGSFDPDTYDPTRVEAGPVYQKGYEGSLARMVEILGDKAGNVLPNFPSVEPTDGKEYYVRIKQLKTTDNSVQLSALIVNHSAWPAVLKTNMSFRYYFTKEAGTTVTVSKQANTRYSLNGVTISEPKQVSGNLYYVEASFPLPGCGKGPKSKRI